MNLQETDMGKILENMGREWWDDLWKIAVEFWKIEKKIQKCREKLTEEEFRSFDFLLNRIKFILWNNKVIVTDFTNQKRNEWMWLLDIVAIEESGSTEFPVIWETISPLVEVNGKIAQRSKVIIYKPKEKRLSKFQIYRRLVIYWLILLLLVGLAVLYFMFFYSKNNKTNIDQTNIQGNIQNNINNQTNNNGNNATKISIGTSSLEKDKEEIPRMVGNSSGISTFMGNSTGIMLDEGVLKN